MLFQTDQQTTKYHELNELFLVTFSWWRHQMEIFSASLALCAGNSPVTGGFPSQRPVTRFGVFFDLDLNKRWSKQSRHRWSRSLWRQSNGNSHPDFLPQSNTLKILSGSEIQWWIVHLDSIFSSWVNMRSVFPDNQIPITGIRRSSDRETGTVKPVYNDHLMGHFSAFWSSSRWPRAT